MGMQNKARSLLFLMKIFGLYHCEDIGILPDSENEDSETRRTWPVSRCFGFFVTLLLFFNVVRYLVAMIIDDEPGSDLRVLRINCLGWFTNCFLSTLILFISCERKDGFKRFFTYYDKIENDELSRKLGVDADLDYAAHEKFFRRFTIFTIIVLIVNFAMIFGMMFFDLNDWTTSLFISPFPNHPATYVAISIVLVFCNAAWVAPMMFVTSFCMFMKNGFQSLKKKLKSNCDSRSRKPTATVICRLQDIRKKHGEFEEAVSLLDNVFRYFLANMYGTSLCMVCFILYQLVNSNNMETLPLFIFIIWLTGNIFGILLISVAAAIVHEEVRDFKVVRDFKEVKGFEEVRNFKDRQTVSKR
ncbi:hypothetical protein FSP39_015860 [Pinctada imbricata]|uniref:Gustatory receptor n=1 Tax=Pinctada imbricata TaxID=66713 RepID=A0AA88Y4U3_PINIB|nr:hypothetical protein FSP39_015860 [Pinctada imbricata]